MSLFTLRHHSDLPLDKDPGTRFLPWLIAFMVYLAALSIVATSIMQSVSQRWERGVTETLTVQIPAAQSVNKDQSQIAGTLKILRAHPAVVLAEPISRDRVMKLLEPWLGSGELLAELPLPHLIDVSLKRSVGFDATEVSLEINKIAPGASIDDHRVWLDRLVRMSNMLQAGAYIILGLISLASIGTIYFVTRTGLAIHHDVIEVLHLIGAQDSYIARQFGEHALHLGLRGGFFGLVAAAPTFGAFAYLYKSADSSLLPQIDITFVQWVIVITLPLLSAAMGYMTARSAVMRTLKRMV